MNIYECFTVGTMNVDFGQWLQAELEQRGMSQADVERAAEGDISGPQISRIISTSRGYESASIRALAKALRMPQAKLFYLSGLATENPDEPYIGDPVKADIWRMIETMTDEQLIGLRMLAEIVVSRGGVHDARRGVSKDR